MHTPRYCFMEAGLPHALGPGEPQERLRSALGVGPGARPAGGCPLQEGRAAAGRRAAQLAPSRRGAKLLPVPTWTDSDQRPLAPEGPLQSPEEPVAEGS